MEHLESENVKEVYEAIAGHFSQTRYKAWPVVDRFFTQLKPSSVGLDVGCGNGKNMRIRPDTTCIGFDLYFPFEYALLIFIFRCWNLLEIVDMHDLEAVYGNMLTLPFRKISFDFAISIAAIHHLSTNERRKHALKQMARVLRSSGTLLVFAWALEQPPTSSLHKHPLKYLEDGNVQDVLVPWVNKADGVVHHRYYHLFKEGELEELAAGTDLEIVESGYDKDNWYTIFRKR